MRKLLPGAVLAAAVLVPAATAGRTANLDLALVPLPKPALGSAARNLPIARDSGPVSNAEAASNASSHVTAEQLARLGRVGGYLLDYGSPFAARPGIREVQTQIDRYRTAADARKGLGFWRRQELQLPPRSLGMRFSVQKIHVSDLPKPSWAYAGTASISGLKPIRGVDAEIQHGPFLLDISVAAGSNSAAARLVSTVARRFYARFRLSLAGRLHARPVAVPPPLKPGPPPHGPKPSALVLRTADLGKSAQVLHKGYSKPKSSFDQNAVSVYDLTVASQGTFPVLSQEVLVGGSSLEVQYFGALVIGGAASSGKAAATPVDLSRVGDNARGEILQVTIGGQTVHEAAIVLSHGPYLDFIDAGSPSALGPGDVRSLAALAAKRLNAGF